MGRRARLELVFARREGRTVLVHAYAEPPFRVGRTFAEGDAAHLILASSAPGVFGGDELEQHITLEAGARVRLTSQSSLQVHASPAGGIGRLHSTYRIEDEAALACDWHPVIPFADARFDQRVSIDLGGRASICWSDAFMAGRVGSSGLDGGAPAGECWAFAELSHELKVVRDGRLEYVERYRIQPGEHSIEATWVAGSARYLGTILLSGRPIEASTIARLHERLSSVLGIRAAADRLEDRLCLVRLAGESGVPFREARDCAFLALIADQSRLTPPAGASIV